MYREDRTARRTRYDFFGTFQGVPLDLRQAPGTIFKGPQICASTCLYLFVFFDMGSPFF